MRFHWRLALLVLGGCVVASDLAGDQKLVQDFFGGGSPSNPSNPSNSQSQHTNNWAVIVCTSRFWFNYRHIANSLSIYRTVKRLGIPDSHIVLMLADDVACNPRNVYPATVFNNRDRRIDLYGGSTTASSSLSLAAAGESDGTVEVDYRGYEVTVENFIRLLTGRHSPEVPKSKRLMTDSRSNVLVYMTGHGGDEFLKFQDAEEIGSHDLADAAQQMFEKQRYHELLFIVDTCQATTLYTQFYSPNIVASGSSLKGENSYSHHHSHEIGVAVIDRYTFWMLEFMEQRVTSMQSSATISQLFESLEYSKLLSTAAVRTDLLERSYDGVLITDFFGNVPAVEQASSSYPLPVVSSVDSGAIKHVEPFVDISDLGDPDAGFENSMDKLLHRAFSSLNKLKVSAVHDADGLNRLQLDLDEIDTEEGGNAFILTTLAAVISIAVMF